MKKPEEAVGWAYKEGKALALALIAAGSLGVAAPYLFDLPASEDKQCEIAKELQLSYRERPPYDNAEEEQLRDVQREIAECLE